MIRWLASEDESKPICKRQKDNAACRACGCGWAQQEQKQRKEKAERCHASTSRSKAGTGCSSRHDGKLNAKQRVHPIGRTAQVGNNNPREVITINTARAKEKEKMSGTVKQNWRNGGEDVYRRVQGRSGRKHLFWQCTFV